MTADEAAKELSMTLDDAVDEWNSFCDRIKAAGAASIAKRPDLDERELLDEIRFTVRMLADSVRTHVGPADLERPHMYPLIDELTPYGLPNADNCYYTVLVDPSQTYRLSGNARGRPWILSVGAGNYGLWGFRELAEYSSATVSRDAGGDFEVLLSVDPQEGNWFALSPEATNFHIRDYWLDWDADPSWFHLEVLDPPPRRDADALAADVLPRLHRATSHFTETVAFWSGYADHWRGEKPNTFSDPGSVAHGSTGLIRYSAGWASLGDGDALIVEFDLPDSEYWSLQAYSRQGVTLDPAVAQSGLNARQAVVDADGVVRMVVSGQDPGVHNWIDNRGLPETTLWYRTLGASRMTTPRTRLVPVDRVDAELPGAARVPSAEREAELRRRNRGFSRRYRR